MNDHPNTAQELALKYVAARFSGAVGELQLARPASRNAVNEEMGEEILLACHWLDKQPQVKAIVFHGAGDVFCAGVDLALLRHGTYGQLRATVDLAGQFVDRMATMKAIVVGAIHGACMGAMGIILAAACDLRYAAGDTLFRLPEAEIGIPPMHIGVRLLAQNLGSAQTLAVSLLQAPLTPRSLYDAAFLNGLCEPGQTLEQARRIAADLAGKPAQLLQKSKQHFAGSRHELIRASERYHQQFMEHARAALNSPESVQRRIARLQQLRMRDNS